MNFYKLYSLTKIGEKYVSNKISDLNMHYTDYQICSYLYFHRSISQDQISENLMIDKTTTSKALKKLEEIHFIIRRQDTNNRRKNIVDLSDKGIEHIKNYVNIHNNWFEDVCNELSEDEQEQFENILNKVLKSANSKM